MLRTSLLPRQCRMEVFRDLDQKVTRITTDAGDAAFQLAGLLANGYLNCDRDTWENEIERYLVSAMTNGSRLATCGAINVLQAMGRHVSQDLRRRILHGFQDPSFQLEALHDVKSLFFKLSFHSELDEPMMHGAARFPFAHKYDVPARLVGFRTWKTEFGEQFEDFHRSREYYQMISVLPISLLKPEVDWPNPGSPRLSSTIIAQYIYNSSVSLENMESHDVARFVGGLKESGMVNDPTDIGLTLLQLAACRGDEATASVLINDLGADIDGHGSTDNWTPLWLACFLGHIDMAKFLVRKGADTTCTDSQGLTLLHLLSQFKTKDSIKSIGDGTLTAGVDINARSKFGVTPLLAAMLVFDYSSGAALEFLLGNGANPLEGAPIQGMHHMLEVCPLSLCILNLDVDALEQMLSFLPDLSTDERKASMPLLAQAIGYQLMFSKTTFRAMFENGSRYQRNLERILRAVITLRRIDRIELSQSSTASGYLTPLEASCALLKSAFDMDRVDLMEMLLVIEPNASVVFAAKSTDQEQDSMLEGAILQQNYRAVQLLIRHGANLLEPCGSGDTPLSRMAREAPPMILNALEILESFLKRTKRTESVKEILEKQQLDTAGIFDLLVLQGDAQDLVTAEFLRTKYDLNHDQIQPSPPNTTTLIGSLIVWANAYGYDRIAQIRYLLSLQNKPRFLMPSGVNLISLSVLQLSDKG